MRTVEDLGESLARRAVRHQREIIVRLETFDRAHLGKRGVAEVTEALHPFAERGFESWSLRQVRVKPQEFQRRRAAVIEHQQPVAEAVRETLRVPARQRLRCGCWVGLYVTQRTAFVAVVWGHR